MTLKIGDIVILRSGGPIMTIIDVNGPDGIINVVWFTDNKELQKDAFTTTELIKIEL